MARLEVTGLGGLQASIQRFGQENKKVNNELMDRAAEYFIKVAQHHVLKDKENLMKSISVLNESDFGQGASIRVGVDMSHVGTRASETGTVRDYAQKIHDIIAFIDLAEIETRQWIDEQMRSSMSKTIKSIFGAPGRVASSIGGFFRRFF